MCVFQTYYVLNFAGSHLPNTPVRQVALTQATEKETEAVRGHTASHGHSWYLSPLATAGIGRPAECQDLAEHVCVLMCTDPTR